MIYLNAGIRLDCNNSGLDRGIVPRPSSIYEAMGVAVVCPRVRNMDLRRAKSRTGWIGYVLNRLRNTGTFQFS